MFIYFIASEIPILLKEASYRNLCKNLPIYSPYILDIHITIISNAFCGKYKLN